MRRLSYFFAAGLPPLLAELYEIKASGESPTNVDWMILGVVMASNGFIALRALLDANETSKAKKV